MYDSRVNDVIEKESIEQAKNINAPAETVMGSFHTGSLFAIAFLAYQVKKNNIESSEDLDRFINTMFSDDEIAFLKDSMRNNSELVLSVSKKLEEQELLNYLLSFSDGPSGRFYEDYDTPDGIIDLALNLMRIEEKESVADLGCGMGCFIAKAATEFTDTMYFGVEINSTSKQIASLKCGLISENVNIIQGDMFELCNSKRFDKVFSNYPFGLQLRNMRGGADYLEDLKKSFPDIVRATSSDWIFNSLIISTIKENGKAIAIMTNGSTWNSTDRPIREYFVRKGFIDTIISLPANLFSYTNIPTTLIVFSHDNKAVRMIDASKVCTKGRRQNVLSNENVSEIVKLASEDSSNSKEVFFDEIEANDFVINPSRYLAEEIEIKDGVEFGTLIKRITRGAPLKADDLDKMVSNEPTMSQYLMLANIKDGIIDENLPYIKEIDQKLEKYCIKNNNLVLSKNGAPFKVAVAEVGEGKQILGNGNLYIIELKEEEINPYYLKAFFESEIGETVLKRIAVGAAMPNIAVDSLKKIIVPKPDMEKQLRVVERTRAKMDEVKVLRLKLERAIQSMKTFFEED